MSAISSPFQDQGCTHATGWTCVIWFTVPSVSFL